MPFDATRLVPVFAVFLGACGCVFGTEAADDAKEPIEAEEAKSEEESAADAPEPTTASASDPRISKQWQARLLDTLENRKPPAQEAWGLFSTGGWSDAGQIMVLAGPSEGSARVEIVEPGSESVSTIRNLSPEEWKNFQEAVAQTKKLGDVDVKSFDGIEYEFVHAVDEGKKPKVTHRIYIRKADRKDTPEHDALIAAFQKLRKKD